MEYIYIYYSYDGSEYELQTGNDGKSIGQYRVPVSYTHLDVYKRQPHETDGNGKGAFGSFRPVIQIRIQYRQRCRYDACDIFRRFNEKMCIRDSISAARIIVEAGLTNYRVDPSQGTHFFQNLTSFGVGDVYKRQCRN